MSVLVYQAINAVAADLSASGIAKSNTNEEDDYQYRSIDDVMKALAPVLARHKLCVLPQILERNDRHTSGSIHVAVRAAFDIVSALDGSRHRIETFAEAIDSSDKATANAISAAYKSAMLQTFCIPVPEDDPDAKSPSAKSVISTPEPPEGWEAWVDDTTTILKSCETADAIQRLCEGRRKNLTALQRSQPALYGKVGELIAGKLRELQEPNRGATKQRTRSDSTRQKSKRESQAHVTEAA